jgi:hypothetical protein
MCSDAHGRALRGDSGPPEAINSTSGVKPYQTMMYDFRTSTIVTTYLKSWRESTRSAIFSQSA